MVSGGTHEKKKKKKKKKKSVIGKQTDARNEVFRSRFQNVDHLWTLPQTIVGTDDDHQMRIVFKDCITALHDQHYGVMCIHESVKTRLSRLTHHFQYNIIVDYLSFRGSHMNWQSDTLYARNTASRSCLLIPRHTGVAVPLRCLYGMNRSGTVVIAVVPQWLRH